jgi:hypothetical protein
MSGDCVTDTRYFSGKLSHRRNDGVLRRSVEAHTCHWCREKFRPGQMRCPVTTSTSVGWAVVSLCMDCFKQASPEETHENQQPRYQRECRGCGEPMLTPLYGRFRWQVCSPRCYQRANRVRKRESRRCICKKWFTPARKSALYCSNACRQWAYRRLRGPCHDWPDVLGSRSACP